MKEYTDQEIIECLRSRQSYVVRYLSARYLPMIRLMVNQMGGTGEDAKDIFQDGLMIILQKIDSNEFVLTCKLQTFLYCVCENLWKNIIAKRQSSSNYLAQQMDDIIEQDFAEIHDNNLYEQIFYEMFETLDPLYKSVLKLHWQEFSYKEIAEKLGYSYGYVKKLKCESQAELIYKVKNHPGFISLKKYQESAEKVIYE